MNPLDIQYWLIAWGLTIPRVIVAFALLPALTSSILPAQLRNGIVIILALFLLPLTYEQTRPIELDLLTILTLVVKECVLGFMLGYAMSIPFWAVKAAGFLMDSQRGAMSAVFFSQPTEDMTSPIGSLLANLMIALLFASGAFLLLLESLFLSYQTWPIPNFFPVINQEVVSFFLQQLDALLYIAVLIAGPLIGITLLIDIGAGLIGRFLPQMNIFMQAMPVKSGVTFFVLALYVLFIAQYIQGQFLQLGNSLTLLDKLMR
ncbi:MAG TPA: type III secretion system export apparatus subunit SctT [Candidatus Thiothrix moscowensis]|uniref:type III secretion system export apparatus subunit SctT n=1 Tax=unclassified Thiothrix TaxID=2636184 RepID=UPI001A230841|nr:MULTISPECIES: type III secretion system export apparatus subunit SctT [unclassified Thiothrix]MBJ6611015.1 type III secretion system export apparatus subunit SctT [Candidatus Thiothrix moscowensis]HRJ54052.1 type III secretion system export apparatus subunit SctT [Candidatus Thiothrix moscowensis]HRJ94198.1 type III secretion system export apparatus subunit SctT [Candidatus Thiothrix moscowensis]